MTLAKKCEEMDRGGRRGRAGCDGGATEGGS